MKKIFCKEFKKLENLESKVFDFSSWGNGVEICPK